MVNGSWLIVEESRQHHLFEFSSSIRHRSSAIFHLSFAINHSSTINHPPSTHLLAALRMLRLRCGHGWGGG
jgi:hypothetical protein